jgi:uncharacterized protein YndB with AHSA1/START domain
MGTTTITAEPGVPYVDITREFDAPRDLLFRAYTEPELLVQWLGPRRLTMVVERWEPRDGGRWRYIHRDDDGSEYGFHGVFHGDQSPDRMVQTFEFEGAPGHVSLESLVLEERDGRTVIHNHSVYQSVADRDAMVASGMESGMNEGFDRLDQLVARLAVPA